MYVQSASVTVQVPMIHVMTLFWYSSLVQVHALVWLVAQGEFATPSAMQSIYHNISSRPFLEPPGMTAKECQHTAHLGSVSKPTATADGSTTASRPRANPNTTLILRVDEIEASIRRLAKVGWH